MAILSQRRVVPPYGMAGGSPGERGQNVWLKKQSSPQTGAEGGKGAKENGEGKVENGDKKAPENGDKAESKQNGSKGEGKESWFNNTAYTTVNLGGSNQCLMAAGDRIVILTPGGGGYGAPGSKKGQREEKEGRHIPRAQGSLANWNAAAHSA